MELTFAVYWKVSLITVCKRWDFSTRSVVLPTLISTEERALARPYSETIDLDQMSVAHTLFNCSNLALVRLIWLYALILIIYVTETHGVLDNRNFQPLSPWIIPNDDKWAGKNKNYNHLLSSSSSIKLSSSSVIDSDHVVTDRVTGFGAAKHSTVRKIYSHA